MTHARSARLDAPEFLHHIMIRGIERRPIFKGDQDREDLLKKMCILIPETKTAWYAWAFLHNHAHFLLRGELAGMSSKLEDTTSREWKSVHRKCLGLTPLLL
jgi:putative transposase